METNARQAERLTTQFDSLAIATAGAAQAAETFGNTIQKIFTHKARWPIFKVRSRKQRIRGKRWQRRRIANRMHRYTHEYVNAILAGKKEKAGQIKAESSAYLGGQVAAATVLRFFERRFSGGREHVLRSLNRISRKARHSPFTWQSGHAAIGHSFLARRDAEQARMDSIVSKFGETGRAFMSPGTVEHPAA